MGRNNPLIRSNLLRLYNSPPSNVRGRHRGRAASYLTPPAQIPACRFPAPGSSVVLAPQSGLRRQLCLSRFRSPDNAWSFHLVAVEYFPEVPAPAESQAARSPPPATRASLADSRVLRVARGRPRCAEKSARSVYHPQRQPLLPPWPPSRADSASPAPASCPWPRTAVSQERDVGRQTIPLVRGQGRYMDNTLSP